MTGLSFSNWCISICVSLFITGIDAFISYILLKNRPIPSYMYFIANLILTLILTLIAITFNYLGHCFKDKTEITDKINTMENIQTINEDYAWGGKYIKEVKHSRHLILKIVFTNLLLMFEYLYCSLIVMFFNSIQNTFDKLLSYLIFFSGWFIIQLIIKLTLKTWKIKMDIVFCSIIIANYLFYMVNYRILFSKKSFLNLKEAYLIVIENAFLEILQFLIPVTERFYNLIGKNCFSRLIFSYNINRDYYLKQISKTYFIRLLALIITLIGTIFQLFSIKISSNYILFSPIYDLDNSIPLLFTFILLLIVELFCFGFIEMIYQKFYHLSALKNGLFVIKEKDLILITILWACHVLQGPIVSMFMDFKICDQS